MRKLVVCIALLLGIIGLNITSTAQGQVRAVVVNEALNIRVVPAIGAEVIATVQAGYLFENINARSPDSQWLRIDFNGQEGWINVAPLVILEGDVSVLPVADPRTIPFGGFEAPRAGQTNASSDISGRLAFSGVRVRAGPSTGYPVLANAPRYTVMPLLGRTADNAWVQVNFESTLGWVTAGVLEFQNGRSIIELPVGGIIADSPPLSEAVVDTYFATLRFMLDRLNLAQPSLDNIRAKWTDSALTGRAFCRDYPSRPSDYNIPQDLLAAYFGTLNPLSELFNDAMFNVRRSIDLFIEVCNQPGTENPVGQATVIGALETVALADQQFAELRARLTDLLPPDRELTPEECLFVFGNRAQILPVIQLDQLIIEELEVRNRSAGYCIDLVVGQTVVVETRQFTDSNLALLVGLSPFDNPTQFISVSNNAFTLETTRLGPVLIENTARYLLLVADNGREEREGTPDGRFALIATTVAPGGATQPILQADPITGEPIVVVPDPFGTETCPSLTFTCAQLTCGQAQACYASGNLTLDEDGDGLPCDLVCGNP